MRHGKEKEKGLPKTGRRIFTAFGGEACAAGRLKDSSFAFSRRNVGGGAAALIADCGRGGLKLCDYTEYALGVDAALVAL